MRRSTEVSSGTGTPGAIVLPMGGLAITAVMLLPIYFTVESSLEPTSHSRPSRSPSCRAISCLSNYRVAFDAESWEHTSPAC